ncbi:unnamed protein product [Pieris macdunnoughi]|uniref:Uncharacterized protein n=1 Tax=Pieris macdunnoughi TaxID=345717 RepID=A0A821U913_9NEOP|nr:unnamed protein product [Pieris macdunnoughi]
MSFKSKVVIVTGASSGIGAYIVTAFAKEGADVVLVARNEERLKKVAKDCEEFGCEPLIVPADITNDDEGKSVIAKTIEKFGRLDVLVNSAGILRTGLLEKGDIMEVFDEVMKINVRAAVNLMKFATPHLIKTKGNIISISSVGGQQVFAEFMASYSTSKAALDMFSRGAAVELGKHGVRVNVVSPGGVLGTSLLANAGFDPKLTPDDVAFKSLLGRWSELQEIADLVLFLASDKAKGVTGSNYTCDNGYLNVKHCFKNGVLNSK